MFSAPMRAIMSIGIIAVVTAGIFIYMALAGGIALSLEREASLLGADLIVLPSSAPFEPEETLFLGVSEGYTMKEELAAQLSQLPEVSEITTQLYIRSLKLGCCSVKDYALIAIDPDTDFLIRPFIKNEANPSTWKHWAVAGCEAASGIHGDKLMFFNHPFRVRGIIPCTGLAVDSAFFISLDVAREIAGPQKGLENDDVSSIIIKLKDTTRTNEVSEHIESLDPNVKVYRISKIIRNISGRVRLVEALLGISLASLVVCGAGLLFFISWLTASSKRQEAALMKAIGASPGALMFMYCAETGITGIVGAALGVIPGAAILLRSTEKVMSSVNAPFVLPEKSSLLAYVAASIALAAAASIISGLIFSIRMVRVEPDTALKDSR